MLAKHSAAAAAAVGGTIRCTRRIRDPLDYLIMQPTDADQVTTSIRTKDAAMVTWYVPLHNLQHCLHKRYEAEQFGELTLPKGVAPPKPKALTPTQDEMAAVAAAKAGPRVGTKHIMTAADLHGRGGEAVTPPEDLSGSARPSEEDPLHNTLNNYTNERGETVVPLGLVTLIVGNNTPVKQGWVERLIDPAPHPTLSMRVMVMDRIHWQRTSWVVGSLCKSLCWGRLPQRVFSIQLDYQSTVKISSGDGDDGGGGAAVRSGQPVYDAEKQVYTSPYEVSVPNLGFKLTLQDTGRSLLDPRTPVTAGFLDNESALHRLALSREVNMLGLGGSVYRQTLWSSPSLPNIANVVQCQFGGLFERYFGCSPVGDPIAAWVLNEVPKTLIYQMEGEVEDENDPNSATTYGDRSLTERVQKKAMNRYNTFRDDIRRKTYSENRGDEQPR